MKRFFLFIFITAAVFSGCQQTPAVGDNSEDDRVDDIQDVTLNNIKLTKSQSEIVRSNNNFAFDLLREIYKTTDRENVFFSPLSLQSVLSMILNGANGETYSQIQTTLGYSDYSLEEINVLYETILSGLNEVDKTVSFSNANSIWLNNIDLKDGYVDCVKKYYNPSAFQKIDFSSSAAAGIINQWCSDNTSGKIDSIVDELNPNAPLAILNALLFQGEWREKFKVSNTKEEPFYLLGGESVTKSFMHKSLLWTASEVDGNKYCHLPFGRGGFSLSMILPDEKTDFDSFLSSFDGTQYYALRSASKLYDLRLSIPKISVESELSEQLKNALEALGIKDAFDSGSADFSKMFGNKDSVGDIKQKVSFKMDENGVIAAASTVVDYAGNDDLSEPPVMVFNANHPFIFFIHENSTGAILLMGCYVK